MRCQQPINLTLVSVGRRNLEIHATNPLTKTNHTATLMSALSLPDNSGQAGMSSFINLVVAARPQCTDLLHAIVGDYRGFERVGTAEHWRGVYAGVVVGLRGQFKSWTWPSDSYYDNHGHHRNPWRQFDAVMIQLQQRTQKIVNKDDQYLDSEQGIRQWRHLMMPVVVDLDCSSCGCSYQERVAVFSDAAENRVSECNLCIKSAAANHEQMLADYLDTLSPRSLEIEGRRAQPPPPRPHKRHRRTQSSGSRGIVNASQTAIVVSGDVLVLSGIMALPARPLRPSFAVPTAEGERSRCSRARVSQNSLLCEPLFESALVFDTVHAPS
jgi:hypothetical protein